jgi:hypothetical protein
MSPAIQVMSDHDQHDHDFRGPIITKLPATPTASFSTVPSNGDVNPYGVAVVPEDFPRGGLLHPGDTLVSNFNNSMNQQGTGSTIVDISPNGSQSVFFPGTTQLGLTTALGILQRGFVIVGSLPTTYKPDGSVDTIGQGSLLILDRSGHVVDTLSDSKLLDGPWDLTINDQGSHAQVFVSNVLSGTVTRIDLKITHSDQIQVQSMTQIASGYVHRTDPNALVIGPTGLAYDPRKEILYVASTGDNAIFAISDAGDTKHDQGMGHPVFQDSPPLRGPLGLVLAPNGDLLTTNGDAINGDPAQPSELIEFTPNGQFVGQLSLDPAQGAAFGLAVSITKQGLLVSTVNDDTNHLDLRLIPFEHK